MSDIEGELGRYIYVEGNLYCRIMRRLGHVRIGEGSSRRIGKMGRQDTLAVLPNEKDASGSRQRSRRFSRSHDFRATT